MSSGSSAAAYFRSLARSRLCTSAEPAVAVFEAAAVTVAVPPGLPAVAGLARPVEGSSTLAAVIDAAAEAEEVWAAAVAEGKDAAVVAEGVTASAAATVIDAAAAATAVDAAAWACTMSRGQSEATWLTLGLPPDAEISAPWREPSPNSPVAYRIARMASATRVRPAAMRRRWVSKGTLGEAYCPIV